MPLNLKVQEFTFISLFLMWKPFPHFTCKGNPLQMFVKRDPFSQKWFKILGSRMGRGIFEVLE